MWGGLFSSLTIQDLYVACTCSLCFSPQAKSNSLLLQREANALAMQQKWSSLDEGSRLTLNLLSKEIDLRNGEVKKRVTGMKQTIEVLGHLLGKVKV